MANKVLLLGILLSFVFGFVCYVVSENLIVSIAVCILTILHFSLFIYKRIKQYEKKLFRYNESYYFINNFIVSLSIKGSIQSSLENAILGGSENFKDEIECVHDLNDIEKILYLKKYFHFRSYQLFVDVIFLWMDEGGNILEMTSYLTNLLRNEEEYISYSKQQNKRVLTEFSILWAFSLGILFSLRFVLNEFYSMIVKQTIFPIMIGALFLFVIFSNELIVRKICNVQIKGWNYEK